MYPTDRLHRRGKLRLLYEVFPMAFLIENAGGKATTGWERVLDIVPTTVHQRSPVYMGSKLDVEDLLGFFQQTGEQPPSICDEDTLDEDDLSFEMKGI